MNSVKSTSEHQGNLDSRIHPLAKRRKYILVSVVIALSCLAFSPAWGGEKHDANLAPIHLTGLSINISPGGFHIGVGMPSYGRGYGHIHVRPAPRHFWKHSRHHHGRHPHYAKPHRFKNRHGWENDRSRGHLRGKGGRGNGRHRGGRW